MDILINIGLVILFIVVLIAGAIFVLMIFAIRNIDKLIWDLPWLKWLSLDEIVEMGFSRFWSPLGLQLLHEKGYLEIRLSDRCPDKRRLMVERIGFCAYTAEFYDFKLTKRGGGRKRRFWLPIVPAFQLEPV